MTIAGAGSVSLDICFIVLLSSRDNINEQIGYDMRHIAGRGSTSLANMRNRIRGPPDMDGIFAVRIRQVNLKCAHCSVHRGGSFRIGSSAPFSWFTIRDLLLVMF